MGIQEFAGAPKQLIKGEDIGGGQIELRHLSPALYTELRKVSLHSHSGQGSRRIDVSVLEGAFNLIYMKSPDGTIWQVTMGDDGAFDIVAVT